MLPDRWNPRLWVRDWLSAPSRAERERWEAAKVNSDVAWSEFRADCDAIRERRAAARVTDR